LRKYTKARLLVSGRLGSHKKFLFFLVATLVLAQVYLFQTKPAIADYTERSPIHISADNEFISANGVVAGSGTESDPYIIENWVIDASSANGIDIRNTTKYFVIRNCLIENGRNGHYYGIYLENTRNGKVENCILDNNHFGIYLHYSSNNTLSGNIIENNSYYGIYLGGSDNNSVISNRVENNLCGLYLYLSSNNTLSGNRLDNNACGFDVDGDNFPHFVQVVDNSNSVNGKPIIYLVGENNLVINQENQVGYLALVNCENNRVENLVLGGNGEGILLAYVNKSWVENVILENNTIGIFVYYSSSNSLIGNVVRNNDEGIYLENSENNTISNNRVNNASYGIDLYGSNKNTISGNALENNVEGIYIEFSHNNSISGNAFANSFSNFSIDIVGSDNNIVSNNILDNQAGGISIDGSNNSIQGNTVKNTATNDGNGYGIAVNGDNNTIAGNSLEHNNFGIYLYACLNSILSNNTLRKNDTGIYLSHSSYNTLAGNIIDNNFYGIFLWESDNNILSGNTVENGCYGISLQNFSDNNIVSSNTVKNNSHGIHLENSFSNFISSNNVGNSDRGIFLENSSSNLVDNNTIENCSYGVQFSFSPNNTLSNNTVENNEVGIYFYSSGSNNLSNNTVKYSQWGVYFYSSSRNTFDNNTVQNSSEYGILLYSSSNNTLSNNIVKDTSGHGIYLNFCSSNTLSGNILENNSNCGICLYYYSPRNLLSSNTVGGSYYGIYATDSDNNTISDSIVENCSYGIYFIRAHYDIVSGNVCQNNACCNIWVTDSTNNVFVANIYDNSYGIPWISNVTVSNVTESTAVITWTTAENADSRVEYRTADYSSTATDGFGTSHIVILSGLIPDTTYYYRVRSTDNENNTEISEEGTFNTLPGWLGIEMWGELVVGTWVQWTILEELRGIPQTQIGWFNLGVLQGTSATVARWMGIDSSEASVVETKAGWLSIELLAVVPSWQVIEQRASTCLSPAPAPSPAPPLTSTLLSVSPSSFSLASGGSFTLTATLKTFAGQPIRGKNIAWNTTTGSLTQTSGITDENGQVWVIYKAPLVTIIENVIITASFAGDSAYAPSKGTSTGTIIPVPPTPTLLSVNPSSFKLAPSENLVLEALLTDENHNPIAGKVIFWSTDKGTLSRQKTVTDNRGRVTVTYTAPPVTAPESVTITASFPGEAFYGPSQASSVGTVSLIGTAISVSLPTYIGSGENLTIVVALMDEAGNFLPGKSIRLAASLGTVTPEFSNTDNSGRATFTYFTPLVTAPTFDFLTASFAGDERHASSVAVKEIAVLPTAVKEAVENVVENVKLAGETFEIPLENNLIKAVENTIIRGNLKAIITITIVVDRPGLSKGFERENIRTRLERVIVGERVEVAVESDVKNGGTVLINLDGRILPVDRIQEVLVDAELATLANDYADVLDPNNDNGRPEYLILKGGKGAQILVSIPHFSVRLITIKGTIAAPAAWSPLLVAVVIVIIVVVLLFVLRRRGSFLPTVPQVPHRFPLIMQK